MKEELLKNAKEFYLSSLELKQQLDEKFLDEFKHDTKNGHFFEIIKRKGGTFVVMLDYNEDIFKGITLTTQSNNKLATLKLTIDTSNYFIFNPNLDIDYSLPESPTEEQFTEANTMMKSCLVGIKELTELIAVSNPVQKDESPSLLSALDRISSLVKLIKSEHPTSIETSQKKVNEMFDRKNL